MSEPLQLPTPGRSSDRDGPRLQRSLGHVSGFEKNLGGAELNVAVGLSRLRHKAGWARRLGDKSGSGRRSCPPRAEKGLTSPDKPRFEGIPQPLLPKEWRALGQLRVYYYRAGSAASRVRSTGSIWSTCSQGEIPAPHRHHGCPLRAATT